MHIVNSLHVLFTMYFIFSKYLTYCSAFWGFLSFVLVESFFFCKYIECNVQTGVRFVVCAHNKADSDSDICLYIDHMLYMVEKAVGKIYLTLLDHLETSYASVIDVDVAFLMQHYYFQLPNRPVRIHVMFNSTLLMTCLTGSYTYLEFKGV